MKKLTVVILIVSLLSSVALFAAGTKEAAATDGRIVLKAYMQIDPTLSQYAGHNAIMAAFAEKYPNIVIEPEYASGEAFHQKFQAMAASKQVPDIFTCYGGARSAYVNATGQVLDLGKKYLTADVKKEYSSATWAAQGANGEYWIIPPSLAVCHTVYANHDLLAKLGLTYPETYEEWLAQIPVIRAAGYYPVSMGNKDPWVVNSWLLSLLVDRLGGPQWFMNAATGANGASFTDEPFVRSLAIIKEMTEKGMFSPGVNQMSNTEADQEFYQGKSVYLIDAGWRTSGMDRDLSDSMKAAVQMHVFPKIKGEVTSNTSTATVSEGFGISSKLEGTPKADAAWTFIRFYTGEEGAAIRASYGDVPSYILDLSKIQLAPMQAKFAEFQAEHPMGYVFDAVMGAEGVNMLNSDIQAMMLGNGDPAAIAAKYEKFVAANER
ncbi:MAG: ABC transporter substrate-binding protein [Sphaerochaetaceae bacterium]|nr:ABC transporter substrate-binding protein [Sphaerochaetaceae bacterium]